MTIKNNRSGVIGARGCYLAAFILASLALALAPTSAGADPVGFTAGQFSVDQAGTANYQVKIKVPPGVHGMQPGLALQYSSHGANGNLGVGWSLSGISMISRCPQTPEDDGQWHQPDLTAADRFCLDGQRLLRSPNNSAAYWASGQEYRTKVATFQRVVSNGTAGTGPASFTVYEKSGLTRSYGSATKELGADGVTRLLWPLDKVSDQFNNYISYTYSQSAIGQSTNEYLLTEVDYGNASTAVGRVVFNYAGSYGARTDHQYQIVVGGTPVTTTDRLNSILVYGPGSTGLIRRYELSYQQASGSGRSLLVSIAECDRSGNCLAPVQFTWNTQAAGINGNEQAPQVDTTQWGGWKAADIDGDGLMDFIYVSSDGTFHVVLGKDQSTDIPTGVSAASMRLRQSVTLDYDGNGTTDLLIPLVNGSGGCSDTPADYYLYSWKNGHFVNTGIDLGAPNGVAPNFYQNNIPIVMDVDGDGLPDILTKHGVNLCGSNGNQETLWYYHNNGAGFDPGVNSGMLVGDADNIITPINFDGQGIGEFFASYCNATVCSMSGAYYFNSAGVPKKFTNGTDFTSFSINAPTVLDFNGDGLTDAVVSYGAPVNQWCLYLNTGGKWSPTPSQNSIIPVPSNCIVFDTSNYKYAVGLDYYGDGHQDLMVPHTNSAGQLDWYVIRIDPITLMFGTPVDTGLAFDSTTNPFFADVNDDGLPDLVTEDKQYLVLTFNNATSPELITQIQATNAAGQSLGPTTGISYLSLALANASGWTISKATPNLDPGASTPRYRPFYSSLPVVVDYSVDSGIGSGTSTQWLYTFYRYGAPEVDTQGHGFMGFGDIQAINANTGIVTENILSQGDLSDGMVLTSTQSKVQGGITVNAPISQINKKVNCRFVPGDKMWECDTGMAGYQGFDPSSLSGAQLLSKAVNNLATMAYIQGFTQGGSFVYPAATTAYSYELNSTSWYMKVITTPTYVAAAGGNDAQLTDMKVETQTSDGGDYLVDNVDSDYIEDAGSWCLGRFQTAKVTYTWNGVDASSITTPLEKSPTNQSTFAYTGCMLTKETSEVLDPSGSVLSTLSKSYGFDQFGNTNQTTVDGTNGDGTKLQERISSVDYDQYGLYPVSGTNALGQQTQSTWDYRFGLQKDVTDANGLTTTTHYDSFGRKSSSQGVLALQHDSWSYAWCGNGVTCTSPNAVYNYTSAVYSRQSTAGQSIPLVDSVAEYDRMGRPVATTTYGLNGVPAYQLTYYDVLGHAYLTSQPNQSGTKCWDYKDYDALNRVLDDFQPANQGECARQGGGVIAPDIDPSATPGSVPAYSRHTSFTYAGLKTTANHFGETGITTLNAMGKTARVVDAKSLHTDYAYDAWGNATTIQDATAQNKITTTFDSHGDRLSMTDPDLGTWPKYVYDATGNLLSQINSDGQTTTFQYDVLGRLTQRTAPAGTNTPEGTSTWKYDIAYGAGIDKLAYVTGPNGYWEGYAYDAYGELTDKITVANNQEYWVSSTYDGFGDVSQVVYPNLTGVNTSTAPPAPTGLSVVVDPSDNAVFDVTWTNVPNGAIYHVFRNAGSVSDASSWTEIYAGPQAGMADDGITSNGTYTWTLEACNGAVSAADCSAPVTSTLPVTLPPTVPGTPMVPSPDAHTRTINVRWAASSLVSTTAGPICYVVQETAPGQAATQTTVTAASENVSLSTDGTYSFSVRSCASGVYSAWTAIVDYSTILTPATPGGLTSTDFSVTPYTSPGTYTVSWQPTTFSGGPVYYVLQEEDQLDANPQFTTVTPSAFTGTSLPISQTAHGEFLYRVEACDQSNTNVCSPFAQTSSPVVVTLPPTGPGTITVPSTDSHQTIWDIRWGASHLPPGVTGSITYYLYEQLNGGGSTYVGDVVDGTDKFIDGHTQNGAYTYEIEACVPDPATGVTGCTQRGDLSGPYNTVLQPPAPASVWAAGNSNLDGTFTVTWTEAPAGISVTNYVVELGDQSCDSVQGQGIVCTIGWTDGGCSTAAKFCTFQPPREAPGVFYVQVETCDTSTVCSAFTSGGHINVTVAAPPTLSGSGYSGAGTATLTWTSVANATSYAIYAAYQTASTGTWGSFTNILNPTGTSKAVSLTSVQSAGHYYVEACDSASCTGPSNTAWLVSKAPLSAPTLSGSATSTSSGGVSMSWTAPSGVADYEVYRSVEQSSAWGNWTLQTTTYNRSYSETLGVLTQAARYFVQACNPIGCSGHSSTLTVTNANYNNGDGGGSSGGGGCPPPPKQCQLVMPDDDAKDRSWGVTLPQGSGELSSGMTGMPTGLSVSEPEIAATHQTMIAAQERTAIAAPQVASVSLETMEPVIAPISRLQTLSAAVPAPSLAPERLAMGAPVDPQVIVGTVSARRAFLLARQVPSSAPRVLAHRPRHKRSGESRLAAAPLRLPVQAIDPRLSAYPPLRHDPRIVSQYEARGGLVPPALVPAADSSSSEAPGTYALMVQYGYDAWGHVVQVSKLDTEAQPQIILNYWQATSANARGEITAELLNGSLAGSGSAVVTSYSYDGATGLLLCAQASTTSADCSQGGSSGDIQADTYKWDVYGNLTERTSAVTGLDETFDIYDVYNRVTSITTRYNGAVVSSDSPTYDDDTGNINKRAGATYNYPQAGSARPHAVSSIDLPGGGTRNLTYYPDGNLQSESGDVSKNFAWYSDGRPYQVTSGTASQTFYYSPNGSRYETVDSSSGDTITTVYIDGMFEAVYDANTGNTTYRNYISAGGSTVAVDAFQGNTGNAASETINFYFHDHLSEVEAVSDSNGQNVTQYSYDPWGKSRPVSGSNAFVTPTWGDCQPSGIAGQHNGYGAHENMDDLCLVQMEGRIYDPELGRFLAVDPTLQGTFSQGLNRYSYMGDNPASGTDPSGYHWADTINYLTNGPAAQYITNQDTGYAYEGATVVLQSAAAYVTPYNPFWGGVLRGLSYATAATAGYLETGTLRGAILSAGETYAFNEIGQVNFGSGSAAAWMRAGAEGFTGGIFDAAGGGRFGDGFAGAFVGSYVGGRLPKTPLGAIGTIVLGGTASKLAGGNFANGATSAAFAELFNELVDGPADKTPTQICVEDNEMQNVGSYQIWHYKMYNAEGQLLTDQYSVDEHLWNDRAHTEESDVPPGVDGGAINGEIHDNVGWSEYGAADYTFIVYQTFTITYAGVPYNPPVVLEHEVDVINPNSDIRSHVFDATPPH